MPEMTAIEYREALDQLGFSQVRFAEMLGYTGRAGQKWATGNVPPAVAILVRLIRARPDLTGAVVKIAEAYRSSAGVADHEGQPDEDAHRRPAEDTADRRR